MTKRTVRMLGGATTRAMAFAAGAALGLAAAAPGVGAQEAAKPTSEVLFEQVTELASNKVQVRVRRAMMPAGFRTPEHTHPGPGPRYIISGSLKLEEGGQTGTYSAGQVFWEAGIPMVAENVSTEPVDFVIIELIPVE